LNQTQGLDAIKHPLETLSLTKRLNQDEVTTFVDSPFVVE
jgi:hypothetical protein